MRQRRKTELCRSWLFLNGAEIETLSAAPLSGADVLIQELEDFTPPSRRAEARELCRDVFAGWRSDGGVVAVRINPLHDCGHADLSAAMAAMPDIVALPKVSEPGHVIELDAVITAHEQALGITAGSTEILPNIEQARGVMQTYAIATASPRIRACLLASEDLAADLGCERAVDGLELAYCRQRFLMECVAAGILAVDYPYTWRDVSGAEAEARAARRLGYKAKSAVTPAHAAVINNVFTPTPEEVARARKIVAAFEAAQASGDARVELDGVLVETPIYANAKRLIARAISLAGT